MKLALIQDDKTLIVAQCVTQYWYYRNVLIYNNLINSFEVDEDRVLLIIGTVHIHLLTQFLNENGDYRVGEVAAYLL